MVYVYQLNHQFILLCFDHLFQVETLSIRGDSADEVASFPHADSVVPPEKGQNMSSSLGLHPGETQKELTDARLLIEALESQQVHLIKELEFLRKQNLRYTEIFNNKENAKRQSLLKLESHHQSSESDESKNYNKSPVKEVSKNFDVSLQARLEELSKELVVARSLNSQYQEEKKSQLSHQHQVDVVCEQVEMETTETILHLQEEVTALQLELNERVCSMAEENASLKTTIATKEEEIRVLCSEWEKAILDLTNFLVDGTRSLKDASGLIENISCSFPQVSLAVNENVERAARICIEKEETILLLQKSLEDAQKMVIEMDEKVASLKGATIAFDEFQQSIKSTEEAVRLSIILKEKTDMIKVLESKFKYQEDQITKAEKRAEAAFLILKWLSDFNMVFPIDVTDRGVPISKQATESLNCKIPDRKAQIDTPSTEDDESLADFATVGEPGSVNLFGKNCVDKGRIFSALENNTFEASSAHIRMVQELAKEIHEMRHNFIDSKENSTYRQLSEFEAHTFNEHEHLKFKDQSYILQQLKDELALTNGRLNTIEACINKKLYVHAFPNNDGDLIEADGWSADYSTSSSDSSTESFASGNHSDISGTCCSKYGAEAAEPADLKFQGDSASEEKKKLVLRRSVLDEETTLSLRKDLAMAFDAFSRLYSRLTRLLNGNDSRCCLFTEGISICCFLLNYCDEIC